MQTATILFHFLGYHYCVLSIATICMCAIFSSKLAVSFSLVHILGTQSMIPSSVRYENQREELQFDFESVKEKVLQLRSHLLRAKNQERAKTKILSELQPHQALLTMDWAIKFLPSKFREAQQDWFAKKGISWHVSAVISKAMDAEYQVCIKNGVHCMSNSHFSRHEMNTCTNYQ